MWANNRGKVTPNSSNLMLDIENIRYEFERGRLSVLANLDISAKLSSQNSINFSQFFSRVRYRQLEIVLGRFYREQGLNSSDRGIGSMLISKNASAIPGIQFRTNSFLPVPFTQGYVEYKAGYGNFWFDDNRLIEDAQLHSKYFYLKADAWSFIFSAGILHNVFWGGTTPDGISLGNSFNDYIRIVLGTSASKNIAFEEEVINTLGNSLAAYDGGLEWQGEAINLKLTRLFFMEDKSNIMLRSFWDGQWSFDVDFKKNPFLEYLRYDYMYTIRQDAVDGQPGGRANYYGHYLYQTGFTYHGSVLGNPFIEFDFENNKTLNNVMIVHSFGTKLTLWKGGNITTKTSYKRSYGVCRDLTNTPILACVKGAVPEGEVVDNIPRNTLRNDQFQLFIQADQKLSRLKEFTVGLYMGFDINQKQNNTSGIGVGIKYYPTFRK